MRARGKAHDRARDRLRRRLRGAADRRPSGEGEGHRRRPEAHVRRAYGRGRLHGREHRRRRLHKIPHPRRHRREGDVRQAGDSRQPRRAETGAGRDIVSAARGRRLRRPSFTSASGRRTALRRRNTSASAITGASTPISTASGITSSTAKPSTTVSAAPCRSRRYTD